MTLSNPGNPIVKKILWAQPHYVEGVGAVLSISYGGHACAGMANDQDDVVKISFSIPSDFTSVTKAVIILLGQWAGNVRLSCTTYFAGNGEVVNTHTDSVAAANITLAVSTLYEYDISAALTGLAAGDKLSIVFNRIGTNVGDTHEAVLPVIGALIEYL